MLVSVVIYYFLTDGCYTASPVKNWQIIASILSIPEWMIYILYQCNTELWSIYGIPILSSHVIILRFILLPPLKEPFLYVPILYLTFKLVYFCWYWSMIFKLIGKISSGNSLLLFIYSTIYLL